jgi:hypothetical protein
MESLLQIYLIGFGALISIGKHTLDRGRRHAKTLGKPSRQSPDPKIVQEVGLDQLLFFM